MARLRTHYNRFLSSFLLPALLCGFLGCSGCGVSRDEPIANSDGVGQPSTGENGPSDIKGSVILDGSSTVHPVASAAVDGFHKYHPKIDVTVGNHGTGGGFQKFAAGEIDVANASMPIEFSQIEKCRANQIKFIELAIGYDGLTVVVNKKNDWIDTLTVEQLKKIFGEESPAKKWKDVDPSWPDLDIKLFIPGASSGTLMYFKEVVVGKKGGLRADVDASEEDNVLVTGVAGNENAIGFFGAAYYLENQDKLKAVKIVNPATMQPHSPTKEEIASGDYSPFSRPLFMYVNLKSASKDDVRLFLEYIIGEGRKHVSQVGYVELPEELYKISQERLDNLTTGTSFHNANGEKLVGGLPKLYSSGNLVD
jgi:phosphate transport system substrate-binding protein